MKIKIRNLLWSISASALMALIVPPTVQGRAFAALFALAAMILSQFRSDMNTYVLQDGSMKTMIISACICAIAGLTFYFRWQPSSLFQGIVQFFGLSRSGFLAIVAVLGSAAAFYSVWTLCCHIKRIEPFEPNSNTPQTNSDGRLDLKAALFLAFVAVFTITICSKSSPLYPLNDWVDSNCFFTVGKSMLNGRVLYRDIYEQKGPLLYALHAVAYLISNTTFLGVYFLEIIAAFAFLLFAYRIALLYCDKDVMFFIPLLAAVVYGTAAFAHGDSAEELCLPLITYALYAGLKSFRYEKPLSDKTFFIIGLTSGCVLWIKYTMLGFYLGWFAVIGWKMLSHGQYKRFLKSVIFITAGVFVSTLPVLLYFAVNQALPDLFEAYFYNNIFLYSMPSSSAPVVGIFDNIVTALRLAITKNKLLFVFIFFSLLWFTKQNSKLPLKLFLCCLLFTTVFIYVGEQHYIYYAFILSLFAINAIPALYWYTKYALITRFSFRAKRIVFCAAGLALAFILNNNAYLLSYEKEDMPQYRFKAIIETVDNPTLLNYGFLDGGFGTVCNIVPNCKYFCLFNLPLSEISQAQNDYAEQGLTDFIITYNREISYEKYECIAMEQFPFEGSIWTYRLYALKALNLQ